jgi:ribosomal-protein-alanine N-acetyltransferase
MFEKVETARLILRKPERGDAAAIFARYGDKEVTHLLAWPRLITIQATHTFLDFSDAEWSKWPVGPYLIESRQDKTLLGSTGLVFETPDCAATGYVLAKDSWWFRIWQDFGVCCRPEPQSPVIRLGESES